MLIFYRSQPLFEIKHVQSDNADERPGDQEFGLLPRKKSHENPDKGPPVGGEHHGVALALIECVARRERREKHEEHLKIDSDLGATLDAKGKSIHADIS